MPTLQQSNNRSMGTTDQPNLREQYISFLAGQNNSETRRVNFCFRFGNSGERVRMQAILESQLNAMPIE